MRVCPPAPKLQLRAPTPTSTGSSALHGAHETHPYAVHQHAAAEAACRPSCRADDSMETVGCPPPAPPQHPRRHGDCRLPSRPRPQHPEPGRRERHPETALSDPDGTPALGELFQLWLVHYSNHVWPRTLFNSFLENTAQFKYRTVQILPSSLDSSIRFCGFSLIHRVVRSSPQLALEQFRHPERETRSP